MEECHLRPGGEGGFEAEGVVPPRRSDSLPQVGAVRGFRRAFARQDRRTLVLWDRVVSLFRTDFEDPFRLPVDDVGVGRGFGGLAQSLGQPGHDAVRLHAHSDLLLHLGHLFR